MVNSFLTNTINLGEMNCCDKCEEKHDSSKRIGMERRLKKEAQLMYVSGIFDLFHYSANIIEIFLHSTILLFMIQTHTHSSVKVVPFACLEVISFVCRSPSIIKKCSMSCSFQCQNIRIHRKNPEPSSQITSLRYFAAQTDTFR